MLDTDSVRKTNIPSSLNQSNQVPFKKDLLPNQTLLDSSRTHSNHHQSTDIPRSIGKPYGDPDNYQNIGDGIYLMNDDIGSETKQSHNLRENTAKSPEVHSAMSLDDVKTIDKQGNEIAVEKVGQNVEVEHLPSEAEFSKDLDISAHHTMQNNNVEFSENDNIEDVSPNEIKMLNTIQGHLSKDDHLTGMNMRESAEIENLKQNVGKERSGSEYTTLEKAVSAIDNQYNDEKTQSVKETKSNSKDLFKKDNMRDTKVKKWSEIKIHSDTEDYAPKRFGVPLIPSASSMKPMTKSNGTKQQPTNSTGTSKESERTKLIINESNQQSSNNSFKRTDSVSSLANSGVAKRNRSVDLPSDNDQDLSEKILGKDSGRLYYLHQHNQSNRIGKVDGKKISQNDGLINVLNKTNPNLPQKYHKRLLKNPVKSIQKSQVNIKSSKDGKVINFTGKKDFQIDLYIGNNDKTVQQQREVKSNVMANNDESTITSSQGTTIFTAPNGMISTNGVITADDEPDDADVSVSELKKKKISAMFKQPQKNADLLNDRLESEFKLNIFQF